MNQMFAKIANIFVVLMLIGLSLAILSNSMTKPVGRDEQMYCTAAVLLAQGKMIYRDFSYAAQLPYHPLLYAALFRMLNTNHYLLVGRLLSVVCDILVMVCIVGVYRHIFKPFENSGILLGLAGAVLYVFNPLVDYANGYAWNNDVVILCVVLSFWLFVSIAPPFRGDKLNPAKAEAKSQYWKIAAIGALLTFASCMRITTALVGLLFFVVLLSQPAESKKQRFKNILPFLIAEAIVLIWPVWVIAQAPRAFFLNLVEIPALYGQWLHKIGMVHNKYDLTRACLTRPGYFVLIALAIYLGLMVVYLRRSRRVGFSPPRGSWWGKPHPTKLLSALLPLIFFVIAVIPPTMWRQYLAMPVPFLIISAALPLLYLRRLSDKTNNNKHFKISAALVTLCVIIAIASCPVVLYRTLVLLVPERWEPIVLHKISKDIDDKLKTQNSELILTLAPLLALEGGCDIYTELSCGSIIYRVADSLSPADRAVTHTVGPETLPQLVEESPPSAVILGAERGRLAFLEAPLQSVVKPDWERKTYDNGCIVYFRP